MELNAIKNLFRQFQNEKAPACGVLDGKYYEIRIDQSSNAEIHWQNIIYEVSGKERLRVQVINDRSIKSCQKCGEEFIPNKFTPYQKYCRNCGSHTPKPAREEVICSYCGRIWSRSKFNPYKEICPDCIKANLEAWKNNSKIIKQPI
jgi:hypothetical protein